MFTITSNQDKVSFSDMINQDLKIYDHSFVQALDLPGDRTPLHGIPARDSREISAALDRFAQKKRIDLAVLVFTSILENGSVIYAGGSRAPWAAEAFPNARWQRALLSGKPALQKAADTSCTYRLSSQSISGDKTFTGTGTATHPQKV